MSLALSFAPAMNYQQVHLALYQDDDNYVQAGFAYNTQLNSSGGLVTTLIWEAAGVPNHSFRSLSSVTSIRLRLDHDAATGNISQLYSLDGTTWNLLGTAGQTLVNPRLCIWVGSSQVPWASSMVNCDLQQLQVVTSTVGLALTYQLLTPPPGASIDTNGVITWTPSEAQGPGTNVITTVVTDNAQPPLSATNSFTVVVNEINTPPVLPAQTNQTVRALATLVVTNTATDSDLPANPLTYQLQTAPTNAVIDTSGVITFMPAMGQALSTNLFVTVVTDYNPLAVNAQHLSATNTFAVIVLPPPGPFLPVQTNQTVNELAALVITNTALDGNLTVPQTGTNTVLFNYTDRTALLADGWSFTGTNGVTPRNTETTAGAGVVDYNQAAHPGVLRIPCDLGDLLGTAQNNTRNSLFRSLPSDWQSVGLALTFAPVTANYQQVHLGLYQDDDNYVQMGVAYNSFEGGERFTVDSEIGGIATTPFKVTTTNTNLYFRLDRNPVNSTVTNSYSFDGAHWTVLGVTGLTLSNPRLMIWTGGSTVAYANGMAVTDLRRLDVVAGTTVPTVLSYSVLNPPVGLTISSNGVITWTPSEAQGPGSNPITTVVTDNGVPPLSATNSFVVVVNEINTPPVLPVQTDRTLTGQQALLVTNTASDADIPTNSLSYQLTGAPTGAAIDTNGVITWTPTVAQMPSTNVFATVVTDYNPSAVNAQHLSATNTFQVVVNAIHNGPTLPAQTNLTIAELTTLTLTNTAIDTDLPELGLTYSLINPPSGMTISSNGVINWMPSEAQGPGTNTVTTVVTDNGVPPLSATNSFVVVVNEINTPPVLPVQTDRTLTGQQALLVTNTANDADIPINSLSYQLTGAPAGAAINTNGVITWTPSVAQLPSTNVFTTVVTDNNPWAVNAQHLSATNSFRVVVNAIHNGPTLPAQTNLTIAELTTLVLTNTAIDSDLPLLALTYSLVNPPSGLTISSNGVMTWTPSEAQGPGTNTITTVVTDNGVPPLSATNSFVVVVNEINTPPVLPVQTDRTMTGQQALLVTNAASDADTPTNSLSYQLTGAPAGAAIDASGVITWTPTLAQVPSTNVFTTIVTDHNPWAVNAQHLSATNSFRVVVNTIHNGPILPAQTNLTIVELTTLSLTNTAIDGDLPVLALTYNLVNPPSGLTINSNGVMTWTPNEAQGPSTNTVTTVVTDNGAPPLSATNSFMVVVDEINTPPVLPIQTDRTLTGQQALLVTNAASDADIPANSLSYQLTGAPAGAAIDTNGVITWTPSVAQVPSTNVFTTVVTDNNPWAVNAQHLSATNGFRVVVNAVHNGPALPAQPNTTIAELTTLTVTNTAIDTDFPPLALTYGFLTAPPGAVIDGNGVINWTPTEAQGPSTNTFTTVVWDSGSPALPAINTFTVVVNEINVAPTLPAQANRVLVGQQAMVVTNTASDSDLPSNSLTYQLSTAPAGAAIDTNGVITWTPSLAQVPGTNVFITVVTDSNPWAINAQHLSATNSFHVVVNAIHNGPALPAQADLTIAELTTLTLTNTAIDPDLPVLELTYSLINPPSGLTISSNGVMTWTPNEAQGPSTNTVTTVVADNGVPPLSATNSFVVVVNEINTPPVLPVQTDRTLTGQQALLVPNAASDADIPANGLSYQLTGAPAGAAIDTNGVITWTPSAAEVPSTNVFTTVVTDNNPWAVNAQHLSATNGFRVVVNAIHNGPALPAQTDLTIAELTTLTQTNTAIDTDLPSPTRLTYSLLAAPANAVIDTNGVIRWTPTSAQAPSTNVFVTTVTDDLVPPLSATNSFTVIVDRLPDVPAPVIQAVIISNGVATVTWSATAGRTYRLQYKNGFQPTNWLDLSPDVLANAPTASLTETNLAVPERFYRVQLLP